MARNQYKPPQEIIFPRADKDALAKFDPATKHCIMNCGPHVQDPRTAAERKYLCDECLTIAATTPITEEE